MRSPGPSRLLLLAGFTTMVAASLWAPPQPELIQDGASCEVAPCGTLEDPARWQTAWWLWALGLGALAVGVALAVRPLPRLRARQLVLGVLLVPIVVVATGIAAIIVSLMTSVHGAATVAALCLLSPVLALVAAVAKRLHAQPGSLLRPAFAQSHATLTGDRAVPVVSHRSSDR